MMPDEVPSRAEFFRSLQQLTNRIHATRNIDEIMLDLSADICALLEADRLTIYSMVPDKTAMVSKVKTGLTSFKQLKLPVSAQSIAGYAALSRKLLNLRDVYDEAELQSHAAELRFQQGVDRRTGYRTAQMLVAPILGAGEVMGVVQLINNRARGMFSEMVVDGVRHLCDTLAVAFAQRLSAPLPERARFADAIPESVLPRAEQEQALRTAAATGLDIEDVLLDQTGVKLRAVGRALADCFGVPYLAFHPERRKPAELLAGFTRADALAHQWVPVEENRTGLYVLCVDPELTRQSGSVARFFPQARPVYCVTTRREFGWMLNQYYGSPAEAPPPAAPMAPAPLLSPARQEELIEAVTGMAAGAHRGRLSELRIETTAGDDPSQVRFLVSGVLRL
jgi:hypothetical protein